MRKKYKVCIQCNVSYHSFKTNFRRIKVNGKVQFENICKKCYKKNYEDKYFKNNLLLCTSCLEFKTDEEFDSDTYSKNRRFRQHQCKICIHLKYKERRKNKIGIAAIKDLINVRFLSAKQRAKCNGWNFSITKKDIEGKLIEQNGKCKISGLELTFNISKGRSATNISIDRINSDYGYTPDNIQLVCMAINHMKMDLSMNDFVYFCEMVYKNKSLL